MVEGFHLGIVVASLLFSKFRGLLLIFLHCYFSFIVWWFMYCSVVFAAVERNTLKWFWDVFEDFFGGVFLFMFFFNLKFCSSLIGWPFVPQDFYPCLQIFSGPSLNFPVFVCCLSFV